MPFQQPGTVSEEMGDKKSNAKGVSPHLIPRKEVQL